MTSELESIRAENVPHLSGIALDHYLATGEVLADKYPRLMPGGDWALSAPATVPAIWGEGDEALWAEGEPLWLVATAGVGKTTAAQRLTRARLSLDDGKLLGYPVQPTTRRIIYVAADRPRQAQRSIARMTAEADRDVMNELLHVHLGPLPFDIRSDQQELTAWAASLDAGTLIIDSLGSVAVDLASDETGTRVNNTFAHVIAADIELVVLHHQRKVGRGDKNPNTIDDVYGSRWFVQGAGSVIYFDGKAGDPVFQLRHFKQPAAEVGPLWVTIDHTTGALEVHRDGGDDLLLYLRNSKNGLTANQSARLVYGTEEPRRADRERIRRRLEKLVEKGLAHKSEGASGGFGGGTESLYTSTVLEPETLL